MIDLGALDALRANIAKHRLASVLLASFVATHIATVSKTRIWQRVSSADHAAETRAKHATLTVSG